MPRGDGQLTSDLSNTPTNYALGLRLDRAESGLEETRTRHREVNESLRELRSELADARRKIESLEFHHKLDRDSDRFQHRIELLLAVFALVVVGIIVVKNIT